MSIKFYLPLILVVTSNVIYHTSAKSVTTKVSPFFALMISYGVSFLVCTIVYIASGNRGFIQDVVRVNWASYALGFALVGLEIGYLFMYRVGWKISQGSVVANIALAVVLAIIGILFYKDQLAARQYIGLVMCVLGVALLQ